MGHRQVCAWKLSRVQYFAVGVILVGVGCSATIRDIDGLPCGDEGCIAGFVCDPLTNTCQREGAVSCVTCPNSCVGRVCFSDIAVGDPCSPSGISVPCINGATDCSSGCRSCQGDGTWSDCVTDSCTDCGGNCLTFYLDSDGDSLGDPSQTTLACDPPSGFVSNANDCDDSNPNCLSDCTDGDNDNFCIGRDCDDTNGACAVDCGPCGGLSMELSVTTTAPINRGSTIALSVDLGAAPGDATSELTCESDALDVFGPIVFTGAPALSSLGLAATMGSYDTPTASPFVAPQCNEQGDYVRLASDPNAELRTDGALNLSGVADLDLSFTAAVDGTITPNDRLIVASCCGTGCVPVQITSFRRNDLSSGNACVGSSVNLDHDNCLALAFSFRWDNHGGDVGLDDIVITGSPIFTPFVNQGAGIYTTSLTAVATGTFEIRCRWDNILGPIQDAIMVTVQ